MDDIIIKMVKDHEETLYGNDKKNIHGLVHTYESFDLAITQLLQEVRQVNETLNSVKNQMVTKPELEVVLGEISDFSAWRDGIRESFKKFFSVKTAKILTVGMVFLYGLYDMIKGGAVSLWELLTKLLPFLK